MLAQIPELGTTFGIRCGQKVAIQRMKLDRIEGCTKFGYGHGFSLARTQIIDQDLAVFRGHAEEIGAGAIHAQPVDGSIVRKVIKVFASVKGEEGEAVIDWDYDDDAPYDLRGQVMLYDQIIIAAREDVSVVCIEAKAEYVAGMLAIHHAGLLLTHLRQYLIHIPEQYTLVVATCEGNQQSVIAGNRLSIPPS